MTTCELSLLSGLPLTGLGSMSSSAGSRVKTLALPALALDWTASAAVYGSITPVWLASFDPLTSSWRTSQHSLEGGLTEFSEALPRSGTMRNGTLYQLAPLVSLTLATGCGLLPTLGKNEPKGAGRLRFKGSPQFRGAKMSEGLRHGPSDPIYLHPDFAELAMGFPAGWTVLARSATPLSRKSPS